MKISKTFPYGEEAKLLILILGNPVHFPFFVGMMKSGMVVWCKTF